MNRVNGHPKSCVIVHSAEQHLHAQGLYGFLHMASAKATAAAASAVASDPH